MQTTDLHPETITVQQRLRASLDETAVTKLMESIGRIGIQSPLAVRWHEDDGWILVAGRHRLEAATRLGLQMVPCVEFADERAARMWEIAENLHRSELTAAERAEHVAEWIKLADAAQVAPHEPRKAGQQPGGINAAVRTLGIERTEAQRSVKIASLTPEAKAAAREVGLDDNRTALLQAAKATPDKQAEAIRAYRPTSTVKPAADPRNDFEVEESQVAALMSAWNKASHLARERFLDAVQQPVFDRTRSAA